MGSSPSTPTRSLRHRFAKTTTGRTGVLVDVIVSIEAYSKCHSNLRFFFLLYIVYCPVACRHLIRVN